LRLVGSIALKFCGRGVSFQDLVQNGALGIIRAAEKFDGGRGVRFGSYATYWIQHFVRQAVYDDSRPIRLPRSFREKLTVLKRVYKETFDQYGRIPSKDELARETGFSEETIELLITSSQRVLSLDRLLFSEENGEGSETAMDRVQWSGDGPEDRTSQELLREGVRRAIASSLSEREQGVINLKYGLSGEEATRPSDIARRFEITAAGIRKIELRALRKLRENSESLQGYLNDYDEL